MKDYAELEKRLQDASLEHQNRYCDVLLEEAAAAISDLTKRLEEARAPKAAWNTAITELAQMPECTAEALDKMRCLYTFIFDAVPEFTFEEEISDVVVRYPMDGKPMSFSLHFAKGAKAFPIWSDPTGLSRERASERELPRDPLPDNPADGDGNAPGDAVKRGFD